MRISIALIAVAILSVTACSDKEDQAQGYSKPDNAQTQTGTPMNQSNMPAGHPGANMGGDQAAKGPAQLMNKELHPGSGMVKNVMHAGGYTYMEVDMEGKPMWVAATAMKVKTGDKIQWQDGAMMQNFSSSSLHRTFDQILFVSNASLAQ